MTWGGITISFIYKVERGSVWERERERMRVRDTLSRHGKRAPNAHEPNQPSWSSGLNFAGTLLWEKGYRWSWSFKLPGGIVNPPQHTILWQTWMRSCSLFVDKGCSEWSVLIPVQLELRMTIPLSNSSNWRRYAPQSHVASQHLASFASPPSLVAQL